MDTKVRWRECCVAVGCVAGESRNCNARRSDCEWSLDRAANRSTACSRMACPRQRNAETAGCIVDPSRCRRHKRRHHPTRCVGSFPAPRRSVRGIEMYGSNATTRCVNPLRDAECEQSGTSEDGTKAELATLRCQAVKIRCLFCSIVDSCWSRRKATRVRSQSPQGTPYLAPGVCGREWAVTRRSYWRHPSHCQRAMHGVYAPCS